MKPDMSHKICKCKEPEAEKEYLEFYGIRHRTIRETCAKCGKLIGYAKEE